MSFSRALTDPEEIALRARDVVIGGFSSHGFALCRTCVSPLRQILCIRDYFSEHGLADAFHGNRRLRLLACDRTPECGGPERGLVISEL